MALTLTLIGSATWTTASGAKTVSATPAVGDRIVLVCAHTGSTSTSATPPTDNSSDGAGTYVLIATAVKASSADTLTFWAREARITVSAVTIFTHNPGTTSGGGMGVIKVAGGFKFGAGLIVQSGKQDNQAATGTPTVTLAKAPLTTNGLVGVVFNSSNTATLTPRASPAWTERADVGYATPPSGLEIMTIDSGETGTSIAWGSTSATEFCSMVVELDAAIQIVPQIAVARGGATFNSTLIAR